MRGQNEIQSLPDRAPTADRNHRAATREQTASRRRVRPPKLAVMVADAIADDIYRRRLAPGTMLSTEAQMIEHFGVARSTIREALRLLEAEELVAVRAGPLGGPIVTEPTTERLARLLSVFLSLSGTTLEDVLEARIVIEPELARRAAIYATEDQIAQLALTVDAMSEPGRSDEAFIAGGADFHTILAEASHNPALALFWSVARIIIDSQRSGVVHYSDDARSGSGKGHTRVVAAIRQRNPEAAAAAMQKHMVAHLAFMREFYSEDLKTPIRLLAS